MGLSIGQKAVQQWLLGTIVSIILDLCVLFPSRIIAKSVFLSRLVNSEIHELYDIISKRARLVMLRRAGTMKYANSMIQHFNPACRAARSFPELHISRLLISFNDNDFPQQLSYSNQRRTIITAGCNSMITLFLILFGLLGAPIQDLLIEFNVTLLINGFIISTAVLKSYQRAYPAGALVIVALIPFVWKRFCYCEPKPADDLDESLFEEESYFKAADVLNDMIDFEAANPSPNFSFKWKNRVVHNMLKPKKRVWSPGQHRRNKIAVDQHLVQLYSSPSPDHKRQHKTSPEQLQNTKERGDSPTLVKPLQFDDINDLKDPIPVDDAVPIGRMLTAPEPVKYSRLDGNDIRDVGHLGSVNLAPQSGKTESSIRVVSKSNKEHTRRSKDAAKEQNSFQPRHVEMVKEEEKELYVEEWKRKGWTIDAWIGPGRLDDAGHDEEKEAREVERQAQLLVKDLEREKEIEIRAQRKLRGLTGSPPPVTATRKSPTTVKPFLSPAGAGAAAPAALFSISKPTTRAAGANSGASDSPERAYLKAPGVAVAPMNGAGFTTPSSVATGFNERVHPTQQSIARAELLAATVSPEKTGTKHSTARNASKLAASASEKSPASAFTGHSSFNPRLQQSNFISNTSPSSSNPGTRLTSSATGPISAHLQPASQLSRAGFNSSSPDRILPNNDPQINHRSPSIRAARPQAPPQEK